jgi:hypothetical protein
VTASGSGTRWLMSLQKRTRVLTAAVASSLVLGIAACGDEDVERNVEEGAQGVKEAGRDAKNAGEDAAKEAEKAGEDAAREAEESANDAQRELEE